MHDLGASRISALLLPETRPRAMQYRRALLTAILTVLFVGQAFALEFVRRQTSSGEVLLLRDCNMVDRGEIATTDCGEASPKWKFSLPVTDKSNRIVYEGDHAVLDRELNRRRPIAVWLNSGGGNLFAGVYVGQVLRKFGIDVRIAPGHVCISACTLAFLGGHSRLVSDDDAFQPHSYSRWHESIPNQTITDLISRPRESLLERIKGERILAIEVVPTLFEYVRTMFHLPGTEVTTARSQLEKVKSHHFAGDVSESTFARIDLDRSVNDLSILGEPAVREVLKLLEKRAASDVVQALNKDAKSLGKGAQLAIRFLERMFSSGIDNTAPLKRAEMEELAILSD
jgi:hypothetical protein